MSDMKNKKSLKNRYFILRHGEALSNKKEIVSCWPEKFRSPLTQKGREQIKSLIERLKKEKIDLIFSSDILRTMETAKIIGKGLGIEPQYDKRLREYNLGIFNGRPLAEVRRFFKSEEDRFKIRPPKGETYTEIEKRILDFLKDIEEKYSNKTILIISHQIPLMFLEGKLRGFSDKEILKKYPKEKRIQTGELRKLF